MANNACLIAADNLSKSFHDGELDVQVLKNISLRADNSERIAIVGSSGSGKSTLLHLLGGLDRPTQGEITLCGNNLNHVDDRLRGQLRNRYLGFIYQFHHLLPEFSALENVAMPLMLADVNSRQMKRKARDILQRVGLGARLKHKPGELSGGERQRVAIARALVTQPKVILADEPTGNLDNKTAMQVYDLMLDLNRQSDTAIIMVTHDIRLAARMDTVYELKDGAISCLAPEEVKSQGRGVHETEALQQ